MDDCYSPNTGEHIKTTNPAPWMGRAGVATPKYNAQTQGCFWKDGAWIVEDVIYETPTEACARLDRELVAYMRSKALERHYGYEDNSLDPILSVLSYAGDPNPRYAQDAADFKAWRSACWDSAITMKTQCMATSIIPTVEEMIAVMPVFVWTYE